MAAVTYWNLYDTNAQGTATEGRNAGCLGTRGSSVGTASVSDVFTIGITSNKLYLSIDGDTGPYITLASGVDLDARYVAGDITNKLRSLGKNDERWDSAICKWENTPGQGNRFKIWSGTLGVASTVSVSTTGDDNAADILGFTTRQEDGGSAGSNNFTGTVSVTGEYKGMLPEVYTVVVTSDDQAANGIGTPVKNIVYDGNFTTYGTYNDTSDTTYTITVDTTNGSTVAGGSGNVPTLSWTASPSADDSTVSTEVLCPDYLYNVGTRGLMVSFSDAVFANGNWTVECFAPNYTSGSNVTDPPSAAMVAISSDRGFQATAVTTSASGVAMDLGNRDLQMTFNPTDGSDYLGIRDEFTVICNGPLADSEDISSVNFGNVTVSTESPLKIITFGAKSGVTILSSVKFGLQSHGSAMHHGESNNDTNFRYGTLGPGNTAGTGSDEYEWFPNLTPADIDSDIPPAYLYATKANLPVVSTADESEPVGSSNLISDNIIFNIRLGSSETGSFLSTYRCFFDFS